MERDSNRFKVYDTVTGQLKDDKDKKKKEKNIPKGAVISAEYIEFDNGGN